MHAKDESIKEICSIKRRSKNRHETRRIKIKGTKRKTIIK
jgi:hypothetical protein